MLNVSPDKILQIGLGFWPAKALLSAVELGVFTALAETPGNLETLRTRLNLHPRGAADFLDALVALGFLQRDNGIYRNAPDTEIFLDQTKPSYIGGVLEMANSRLYPFWGNLTQALRTGEPQNEVREGEDPFAAIYADPQRLDGFLRAMSGISRGANITIAEKFPWQHYKTFIDVGTAQGDLAVQIARRHPHLTGVGFDLPATEAAFTRYAAEHHLSDRLRFIGGNFFQQDLPPADVVLMGHILHDWNLEQKQELIAKAYAALSDGGALVVYDALIDDDRRQGVFGLLMSLNMLIETPGGFDYTGADCSGWMRQAGFRDTAVEHLVGPDFMVIGIK